MRKNLHPLAAFGAKENIATIANGLNRTIRPFFTLRRFFRRHSCKNCTPTSEVFFRQILQSSPVEHELFRVAHFFKRPPISALESANFFRAANGLVGFCYGLLHVKQNCFFAGSKAFYGLGPAGLWRLQRLPQIRRGIQCLWLLPQNIQKGTTCSNRSQPTLLGRWKLFRCLPKRRCWCFRWCREASLPASTASSKSSTS